MAKQRNPKGLGSYYKKDDLFCWKYVRDGKAVYRSSKTEKGLQEKVRRVMGTGVSNDKTKVSKYFEDWLKTDIKPLKKQATYEQYKYMYDIHIKPIIGSYKMTSIKQSDIQKVITEMAQKDYSKRDEKGKVIETKIGTATKTMKHAKTVMNGAFTKAFKIDKIIPENPVYDIQIPKKQAKPRKTLNTNEIIDFMRALEKSRWIWSVKFALVTGLRRGELLALKWTDIDWDNNRIIINKSNSSTGLGDTKSAKIHYVPLSKVAKAYLFSQRDMLFEKEHPYTFNDDNSRKKDLENTSLLVFPTEKGTMIKPNTYYHTIVRFAEKAGVKVHPHMFRHTFVFNMRNKLSLKELQAILGHDESTTTLDIYGTMINDTVDYEADTIDKVFSKVELEYEKAKAEAEERKFKVIDFSERKKAK